MSHVGPDSPNIIEDIHRAVAEKAAVRRAELWEKMGFPRAKVHMPESEYDRDYRGRIWFNNKEAMEQATLYLKLILCPQCVEDQQFGVKGTRFFITVEDDVMTVFPAVGHFVCHHCGFEEWHPLKHDPRENMYNSARASSSSQNPMYDSAGLGELQDVLAQKLGQGINPGLGPIYGMTDAEKQALHRLYQRTQNMVTPPPPIVSSKEEAELLLKLAPVERRQAIIQKLRDLGEI